MSQSRYVLVTGITGQQGGSVARALLKKGHKVRGLTRNLDSAGARKLSASGVELVAGDFTNMESLERAFAGVDAVYAMTTPFEKGEEAETAQGLALLHAAKSTNVGHFVYSSVASADQRTGIPHFDSKYAVEEAILASGVPYSISAPVYFMENLLFPWTLPGVLSGTLAMAMPADRDLQQIAVADIGNFAVSLIERRESVFGKRYDIAGDELTNSAAAELISGALGRGVEYQGFSPDLMREQSEDLAIMYQWFIDTGYSVNIDSLRSEFPEVGWQNYRNWVNALDWEALSRSHSTEQV